MISRFIIWMDDLLFSSVDSRLCLVIQTVSTTPAKAPHLSFGSPVSVSMEWVLRTLTCLRQSGGS